jgi:hypothetical protein
VLAALVMLAACTHGSGGPTSAPSTVIQTQVITKSASPPPPVKIVAPIKTGPTTAAIANACPFLDEQPAVNKVGMRLDKITVLRSGGKTVGCRFYGLQHPNASCDASCLTKENLPGPHQPAIEIETYRYPSAKDAYNGFVSMSKKEGSNIQQDSIVGKSPGLCFETHFYPTDKGTDWACAFHKGATGVMVRTVVTKAALSVRNVARAIAARV